MHNIFIFKYHYIYNFGITLYVMLDMLHDISVYAIGTYLTLFKNKQVQRNRFRGSGMVSVTSFPNLYSIIWNKFLNINEFNLNQ